MIKKIFIVLLSSVVLWSCDGFNNTATFEDFVQWSQSSTSIDEDATTPIEVEVQLVGAQKSSDLTIEFTVEEVNVSEGVNYSFPNGKTLIIPANSSSATIQIAAIDNEIIAPGEQYITLTLVDASGVSVGSETAPNRTIKVSINENDFWCPRNQLAKVITKETDVGYSSSAVSIELVTSPDGCLSFRVEGGGGSILGTSDITFGAIALTEDSPESNTGTIDPAVDLLFTDLAETGSYGYTMDISNGTYDLSAGSFQFDYNFYDADGNLLFPGTLLYEK